ncbi:MAG: ROK family protein [Clostridia bacterium]|nr:ROK family protein [Clostridia bacterium]
MNKEFNLGIDIGGTKCAVVLGRTQNDISVDSIVADKISFPTNQPRGWRKVVDEMLISARKLIKRNSNPVIKAVGISCGGPLDSKKGIICCPPNLPDWDNVPICRIFEEEFHCPVILQNDANACAAAEWRYGAGKGLENMIFLTFGTGMGAGLILGGRLYSGTTDLAGEVGHIRLENEGPAGYGKEGSFEGFCSGGGIARLAQYILEREKWDTPFNLDKNNITAKALAQAAFDGDEFAVHVYDICAQKLGKALSLLIDILNPQAIVIGSIYQRSRMLFEETIKSVIKQEALSGAAECCKILPAALGDSIGDLAALSLCL